MPYYNISVDIFGPDPNRLREECENWLPGIWAQNAAAAQVRAEQLLSMWINHNCSKACTGAYALCVSVSERGA